jgi:hypothetical protein
MGHRRRDNMRVQAGQINPMFNRAHGFEAAMELLA